MDAHITWDKEPISPEEFERRSKIAIRKVKIDWLFKKWEQED